MLARAPSSLKNFTAPSLSCVFCFPALSEAQLVLHPGTRDALAYSRNLNTWGPSLSIINSFKGRKEILRLASSVLPFGCYLVSFKQGKKKLVNQRVEIKNGSFSYIVSDNFRHSDICTVTIIPAFHSSFCWYFPG